MSFPKHIVLKSAGAETYLGSRQGDDPYSGWAEFTQASVVSAGAKFKVEPPKDPELARKGLVNIRSCTNNKYLTRAEDDSISTSHRSWLTITAKEPIEDVQPTGTLFLPILVDPVYKNYRFKHYATGKFLHLVENVPETEGKPQRPVDIDGDSVPNVDGKDVFKVIDWDSLVILPQYVAFKGSNGKYLQLTENQGYPYLQFSAEDIGSSSVAMEIFYMKNGDIRVKPVSSDKFWRRSPNWIWADSSDTGRSNQDTLFNGFKVNSKTIALKNMGNNRFCSSLTTEGKYDCLNAAVTSITRDAYLIVEEPVMTRKIEVVYDTVNSRVYDEVVHVVAKNSVVNKTGQTNKLDVKLSYSETMIYTWQSNLSLKLGMKTNVTAGIPLIVEGSVEVSTEIESGIEWGETKSTTTIIEVVHQVAVPPKSKVTVDLLMTHGKCDVPFSFIQRDTLYDGKVVTTTIQGNTYFGANYYNIQYDTTEEPLTS